MPYAHRPVHDADAHIHEMPDWLDPYLTRAARTQLREKPGFKANYERYQRLADIDAGRHVEDWPSWAQAQQRDSEFRKAADENLMLRKHYEALGAFLQDDRKRALDLLGFASQLIFATYSLGNFDLDETDDVGLAYACAHAHNCMITDFCTADPRLLAVGFVPLDDFERAAAVAADAMKLGCKAIRVPGRPARGNSPSHIAADRVWAMAQEAGIPIVFHIDGKEAMNKAFFSNGLPAIKDFRGGDSDHSSIGYIQTPNEIMATLTALIFDGVMDRFPKLKFGVIEQGASWAPSWLQWMDATFEAFSRNEERLRKLSERPCDIARRQVRITPFPHENVSWIIANTGPKMILFSSDYPHVEGGRNPLRRFEASLQGASEAAVEGFYTGNFEDLLGAVLSPLLRRGAAA